MVRNALILCLGLCLSGCSGMPVPDFLGRGGGQKTAFDLFGPEGLASISIAPSVVVVEPALNGAIIRVEGVAPTQGYHSPQLLVANIGRPDASGTLQLEFVAIPPPEPADIGPNETRELRAGFFVPERANRRRSICSGKWKRRCAHPRAPLGSPNFLAKIDHADGVSVGCEGDLTMFEAQSITPQNLSPPTVQGGHIRFVFRRDPIQICRGRDQPLCNTRSFRSRFQEHTQQV